ncbi:MAG: patatin-like phospholipase family protein [Leptospira sp.]|nr:patatin-like phospholipase family protein [Leptospira sp.]
MTQRKKALILSGGGGRGAYQAGVFKYLEEQNFVPDIICGTSVGAINSVAIASGMDSEQLVHLWEKINSKDIFQLSIWRTIWRFITRQFSPFAEISPLKSMLEEKIDLKKLAQSPVSVYISAVNIINAELRYFTNKDITISHILASSAIPLVFPWQYINGLPYWDGGLMANTPIQPAIEQGAMDIVVVLLSPVGAQTDLGIPRTRREGIERVFELSLIGSYQMVNSYLKKEKEKVSQMNVVEEFLYNIHHDIKNLRITTISPSSPLGMGSIMNFSPGQSKKLIQRGYEDARKKGLFK